MTRWVNAVVTEDDETEFGAVRLATSEPKSGRTDWGMDIGCFASGLGNVGRYARKVVISFYVDFMGEFGVFDVARCGLR